jgi:hypothetical protein
VSSAAHLFFFAHLHPGAVNYSVYEWKQPGSPARTIVLSVYPRLYCGSFCLKLVDYE